MTLADRDTQWRVEKVSPRVDYGAEVKESAHVCQLACKARELGWGRLPRRCETV